MGIMIYQFNESEWNMIVHTFEANKNSLSLVMRDNLKNLLNNLKQSRTITSKDEAEMIVSFLVSCGQNKQDMELGEDVSLNELSNKFEETEIAITIEQIIEQLRLFINRVYEDSVCHFPQVTRNRG
ncbi:MAG: hypothetical protein K6G43_03040 [Lachnospiraceae bacterium]|nr:hypothetical protein [Lachnospiraceae bacterium]